MTAASDRDQAGADRLRAVHEQLTAQVSALTQAPAWQQMLSTAARLHTYSPSNLLLITAQYPQARAVAGYGTWQQLGRQVRSGQTGIAILAPVHRSHDPRRPTPTGAQPSSPMTERTPPAPAAEDGAVPGRRLAGFRVVHVFDIAQTDGPDLPTGPLPELLAGQAPAGLHQGLTEQVTAAGYTVLSQPLPPVPGAGQPNGLTDHARRTVTVHDALSDAQATKTLAHELGHVLLHAPVTRPAEMTRAQAEVEAESVAYIVTAAHGLDAAGYTVPYVTGWSGGDLTLVRDTADRVLTTARQVLHHTPPPPDPTLPTRTTDRAHDRTASRTVGRGARALGEVPGRVRAADPGGLRAAVATADQARAAARSDASGRAR